MISIRLNTFLALAALFLSGCRDIPDYPAAPQISLKEVRKTVVDYNGLPTDKLDFVINFTDGDGDLGLSTSGDDMEPPYHFCQVPFNSKAGCDVPSPNFNNWRMKFFVKQDGEFVPHPTSFESFSGRFHRLEPEGLENSPLDGTITYSPFPAFVQIFFAPNTVAKFEIQILDRSFNASNIIETGEIILNEQ